MLGTRWTGRKSNAERTAQQAWEYLSSAVASAGDNASWARRRGAQVADLAGDRVGSAADVAWQRANAAVDALAGRKPALPWALIAGAGVLGLALGVAVASAARTATSRMSSRTGEASATDRGVPLTSAPSDTSGIEIVDVDAPATTPVRLDS